MIKITVPFAGQVHYIRAMEHITIPKLLRRDMHVAGNIHHIIVGYDNTEGVRVCDIAIVCVVPATACKRDTNPGETAGQEMGNRSQLCQLCEADGKINSVYLVESYGKITVNRENFKINTVCLLEGSQFCKLCEAEGKMNSVYLVELYGQYASVNCDDVRINTLCLVELY